jgi:multiple sugar transport system substrate-binding protein
MRPKLPALWLSVSFLGAALGACGGGESAPYASASSAEQAISIWWFQWEPADGLAELAAEFQAETGIAVNVQQIPLSNYQDKVFLEFGNARTAFDIVIGDSQWIGRGATRGLYEELSAWLPTVVDLATIHPRAARYLCEYPSGSGRFYAAPCETDATGLVYRRDWFEDPAEKQAFEARYGYPLAVPETWDEFRDVAEFFHRPEEKRYGCALPTGRAYDALTMGLQNVLWSFGGAWKDAQSNRVVGFLDTEAGAQAIDFYKELIAFGPQGAANLDYGQVLEVFTNGSTAMLVNYFAFFPGILATFGERVGFAVVPGKDGRRVASLGGQGFSISARIPESQKELCKRFIAWFLERETQLAWIQKPAGFTAHAEILKSPEFRAQTPYNAPFADSVDAMQDFWNVPVFNELLAATQRWVGMAIDGETTSAEALKQLAIEKERILREAGLL